MNRTKKIKSILEQHFSDFIIKVKDNSSMHKGHNNFDGTGQTHILIEINTKTKIQLDRLEIHRKINSLLSEEYDNGLHSLEIKIIL